MGVSECELVATVTTLRASLRDTLDFVHYHLNAGVDHMYLFFDDPTDRALDVVRGYAGVTAVPCTEEHWAALTPGEAKRPAYIRERQKLNATMALGLARDRGMGWLFHIDADELLHTEGNDLRATLARISPHVECVVFLTQEAVPEVVTCDRPFKEISLFRRLYQPRWGRPSGMNRLLRTLVQAMQLGAAGWAGCRVARRPGSYFHGHTKGKAGVRLSSRIARLSLHRPRMEASRALGKLVHPSGHVLHYDGCTFERWFAKWQARYEDPTRPRQIDRRRMAQLQRFADCLEGREGGSLEELYQREYSITPRDQRVLDALGLLRRLRLSPALFEIPRGG